MSTNIGSIHYDVDLNTRQFDKKTAAIRTKMKKLGSSMKNVGRRMSMALTLPIVAGAGISIKRASDLYETINKVDVAFGNSAESIKAWSKTTIDKIGLAGSSAMESAALFGDMGTSMGQSRAEAAKMSMKLTELGGDLASFKNIGIEQATDALTGIYTGNTISLKKLGFVMTEARLKQFALTKGMVYNREQMTQAQIVGLRYQFMMEATKNAQGDFARTLDGTANQIRVSQERFKELTEQIGQKLIPVTNKVLLWVQKMMAGFSKLSPTVKKIIGVFAILTAVAGPLLLVLAPIVTAIGAIGASGLLIVASIGLLVGSLWLLENRFGVVSASMQWLIDTGQKLWSFFQDKILPILETVATMVLTNLSQAWDSMKGAVGSIMEALAPFKDQLKWLAKFVGITLAVALAIPIAVMLAMVVVSAQVIAVIAKLISWFVSLWAKITETGLAIWNWFTALPGKIKDLMSDAGSWLVDAGKNLVQGFINGIKNSFGAVKRTLGNLTSKLTSWKGPVSKDKILLERSGELVMGGFVRGLENMYGATQKSLGNLTNGLAGSTTNQNNNTTNFNAPINIANTADAEEVFKTMSQGQTLAGRGIIQQ